MSGVEDSRIVLPRADVSKGVRTNHEEQLRRVVSVSMEAAERQLGYRPVTTYPEAVQETCAWLVAELERGRSWEGSYIAGSLDYAAEDAVLTSQA